MIGKITSIKDGVIYVSLNINIYEIDNLINKNVTFDNRYIGEVVGANSSLLQIILEGEIINGVYFHGGLSMPKFSSECRLTTREELDIIYGIVSNDNNIRIGKSFIYRDYDVYINVNKFFSSHFAVFGNSGSGKSYFVSKLLQGIFYEAKQLPYNPNIFLFDAYGEYQRAFNSINQVNSNLNYRVITTDLKSNSYEKLFVPFWFLGVDDICLLLDVTDVRQIPIIEKALKLVTFFTAEEEKVIDKKNDIIARSILDIILSGESCHEVRNKVISILSKFGTKNINLDVELTKGGWTRTIRQCLDVENNIKFADIEIIISYLEQFCMDSFELSFPDGSYMYSIKDFYNSLEFALISEGIFSSNSTFDYANVLKIRLNSLINSDYVNYFNCDRYMNRLDYIKYLIYDVNTNKKYQIVNFNVNYVDDRFAKVIVKIYSKMLFDFIVTLPNRASMPFHIILEEAHRYIQDDMDLKVLGYNIFERIAKEGRKYGVLLGIISQRPSEISATMVSQCSNFAIFKIFNEKDLNFVKNTIPYVNSDMIEKTKMLSSGNCILFGSALKKPILSIVDMPNPTPYSDSCNISSTWYVK